MVPNRPVCCADAKSDAIANFARPFRVADVLRDHRCRASPAWLRAAGHRRGLLHRSGGRSRLPVYMLSAHRRADRVPDVVSDHLWSHSGAHAATNTFCANDVAIRVTNNGRTDDEPDHGTNAGPNSVTDRIPDNGRSDHRTDHIPDHEPEHQPDYVQPNGCPHLLPK